MTSLKLFGATALFSVAFATGAFAQAAISEPGAFAFYHPYADVLNARPIARAGPMAAWPAPEVRRSARPYRRHRRRAY